MKNILQFECVLKKKLNQKWNSGVIPNPFDFLYCETQDL